MQRHDAARAPMTGFDERRNLGLDVVRSVAILMVLLAHEGDIFCSWMGWVPPLATTVAGLFGVELFFVLSGFLIGRLLLDIVKNRPTWRELLTFLVRRWMRTLPLYFVWLGVLVLLRPPPTDVAGHVLEYATFTQNLFHPMPADNFFGVSWSLAIEEWFYLLFGSALIGCAALTRRTRVGEGWAIWVPLAVFLLVPALLRCAMPLSVPIDSVLGKVVLFRLDGIAYGVLLARLSQSGLGLLRWRLSLLAVGVLLVGFVWSQFVPATVFWIPLRPDRTLLFSVVDIGFMLCLPAAIGLRCRWQGIAAIPRAISTVSYGVYITHLSILLEINRWYRLDGVVPVPVAMAAALLLPFGLAWLSYRFFEQPILARRPRQGAHGAPAQPVAIIRATS